MGIADKIKGETARVGPPEGAQCVRDVMLELEADGVAMKQGTVTRHLRQLEAAGKLVYLGQYRTPGQKGTRGYWIEPDKLPPGFVVPDTN